MAIDLYNFLWVVPNKHKCPVCNHDHMKAHNILKKANKVREIAPPPPYYGWTTCTACGTEKENEPFEESPASQQDDNQLDNNEITPAKAVILFPALLTPLVYVQGKEGESENWLELLIASNIDLDEDIINRQLKIGIGLDPEKWYDPVPMFSVTDGNIKLKSIGTVDPDKNEVFNTHSKFAGIIHPTISKRLKARSITKVYEVRVFFDPLDKTSNIELQENPLRNRTRLLSNITMSYVPGEQGGAPVKSQGKEGEVGDEEHDRLITGSFKKLYGKTRIDTPRWPKIAGRGRFGFKIANGDVDPYTADENNPIQTYHPIHVFTDEDAKDYSGFGHLSDIHVNVRWQTLAKSPARVIEHGEGLFLEESPKIGTLTQQNNIAFKELLGKVGEESDIVLIGGDLVDHARNAYGLGILRDDDPTVAQVWSEVNLTENYKNNHPPGLDMIAFWSFVIDAIRTSHKPHFGVSGNHDCYEDAYGISPRVAFSRTNDGIPSDLNLTFYEALLAFGKSFGETVGTLTRVGVATNGNFNPEWFAWYHSVCSPFNDFWYKLPNQSLVGLGWGGKEELIDLTGDQALGHLPRSLDGVSDDQTGLVNMAVADTDRRLILVSHFTFLSFNNDVPMSPGKVIGSPGTFGNGFSFSEFEMGTFTNNRSKFMELFSDIQMIFTGHSHRRGLYLLDTANAEERRRRQEAIKVELANSANPLAFVNIRPEETIPAFLYDTAGDGFTPGMRNHSEGIEPAIIVSDSAGPYPKYNLEGEFQGWGADKPGATVVTVNASTGDLESVRTVQATSRAKPRAAVSLDYCDVDKESVFEENRLYTMLIPDTMHENYQGDWEEDTYCIKVPLTSEMICEPHLIEVEELILSGKSDQDMSMSRIKTVKDGTGVFRVPGSSNATMYAWLENFTETYVSLKLKSGVEWMNDQYEWNDYWNFEVIVKSVEGNETDGLDTFKESEGGNTPVSFIIQRPSRTSTWYPNFKFRELPNFDYRIENYESYQG